jgi:hypothetical protein
MSSAPPRGGRPRARAAPADPRLTDGDPGYRYEREVEEFLRWSPSVRESDRLGLERLSPEQLSELARALDSLPGGRPER